LPRRLSNPGWYKQALLFLKKKKQKDFFYSGPRVVSQRRPTHTVMAGLDPAIHAFDQRTNP
jgi:hypothetical protein